MNDIIKDSVIIREPLFSNMRKWPITALRNFVILLARTGLFLQGAFSNSTDAFSHNPFGFGENTHV